MGQINLLRHLYGRLIWKSLFGNPLCVPGNCQTIYKSNIHNYLKLKFKLKIFYIVVSEQLYPESQAFFKTHLGLSFLVSNILIQNKW